MYGPGQRIRKLVALLFNPNVRACALIRIACCESKTAYRIARNLLVTLHSIDIGEGLEVGVPLSLPHPIGIVLGRGVVLGDGVTVYHNVTIGAKNSEYPVVQDNVTIYPNAIIVGGVTVGRGAIIGAGKFVDRNVPSNKVVR